MEGYSQELKDTSLQNPSKASSPSKDLRFRSTSSASPKKASPSPKKSPSVSPNKISWMRASDEDLLNRIKSIPKEPSGPDDQCGNCMVGILELLQAKLSELLEEKLNLRKARKAAEEELRSLNETNTKVKSELYADEKYLTKLYASNEKTTEEIVKLQGKIDEVVDQDKSVDVHGSKITSEEQAKLASGETYFEQLKKAIQDTLEHERSVVSEAEREEQELAEALGVRTQECEDLRAKIAAYCQKESDRHYLFKSVADTIGGSKQSKILKQY